MNWLLGRRLPRWLAAAIYVVALPAAHAVIPWALSLLGTRHGWIHSRPGPWNLFGLIPVALGAVVLVWAVGAHFKAAPAGWRLEKTPYNPTPAYLLREGPYRYTRNPIYMAEALVWVGWIIFYGSLAVLGVFAGICVLFGPVVVRREERGLEARFGEAYRVYKRATPRWLGKPG